MNILIALIAGLLIFLGITLYLAKKLEFNPVVAFFTAYVPLVISYILPLLLMSHDRSNDFTALFNAKFVSLIVSPYFYLASTSIGFLIWLVLWLIKKQSTSQNADSAKHAGRYFGEIFSWNTCFRLLIIYIVWSKYISTMIQFGTYQLSQATTSFDQIFHLILILLISFIPWLIIGALQRVHRFQYLLSIALFIWIISIIQFFIVKPAFINMNLTWFLSLFVSLIGPLIYASLAAIVSNTLFKPKRINFD